ncbi:unnamed protein product [Durusdinium trenchii]
MNFEHLSLGMDHAKKNRLLDGEELLRLEELNHAAHAAKQDGLGIDDPEQAVQKKDEDQDMEAAGNCIGDLQNRYSLVLGRPLAKNEPRYRKLAAFSDRSCGQTARERVSDFVRSKSRTGSWDLCGWVGLGKVPSFDHLQLQKKTGVATPSLIFGRGKPNLTFGRGKANICQIYCRCFAKDQHLRLIFLTRFPLKA